MVDIAALIARYPKQVAKYDPTTAYENLASDDPATRLMGAKWITRQAAGIANNFTEYWLKDPASLERLSPHLHDPDPRVAEEAITAAALMASPRYSNHSPKVASAAVGLLSSERPHMRSRAAMLLMCVGDETFAPVLMQLFHDPSKAVQAVVVREIASIATTWSPDTQERLRREALALLEAPSVEVRCAAARLLVSVGQSEDITQLKGGLKAIKGANWRQDYNESLSLLKSTASSPPTRPTRGGGT